MFAWLAEKISLPMLWVAVGVLSAVLALAGTQVVIGKVRLSTAQHTIDTTQVQLAQCQADKAGVVSERNDMEARVREQNGQIEQMAAAQQQKADKASAAASTVRAENARRHRVIPTDITPQSVNAELQSALDLKP